MSVSTAKITRKGLTVTSASMDTSDPTMSRSITQKFASPVSVQGVPSAAPVRRDLELVTVSPTILPMEDVTGVRMASTTTHFARSVTVGQMERTVMSASLEASFSVPASQNMADNSAVSVRLAIMDSPTASDVSALQIVQSKRRVTP